MFHAIVPRAALGDDWPLGSESSRAPESKLTPRPRFMGVLKIRRKLLNLRDFGRRLSRYCNALQLMLIIAIDSVIIDYGNKSC
jgi:hypothetical protein